MINWFNSKIQPGKPKINFRPAIPTNVITGSAFESAGTFDIEFVPNNVVGAFLPCSFFFANIARTARSNITESSERIGHKIDLRFSPFWEL